MKTTNNKRYLEPGKGIRVTDSLIHTVVLVLSVILVAWISYDTFNNIHYLTNHSYMEFQFWVCVVFLIDFFFEFFIAEDKKRYLANRWFFFLISIPYLNILPYLHLDIPKDVMYYLRFIPLVRGCYSLVLVMGYISRNRAVSLLAQYAALLISMVYIISLLFYYEEYGVNPDVKSEWDALYWAAMNCTTVGCYFSAITPVGKVLSVILPTLGMLMLPLFTVYVTDKVQKYDAKVKNLRKMAKALHQQGHKESNSTAAAPAEPSSEQ